MALCVWADCYWGVRIFGTRFDFRFAPYIVFDVREITGEFFIIYGVLGIYVWSGWPCGLYAGTCFKERRGCWIVFEAVSGLRILPSGFYV